MKVNDVLAQIEIVDGKVKSKSTGILYEVNDFIEQISKKLKFTKRERQELESYFSSFIKPQSEQSKYIETIIDKYDFQFSDGVYFINGEVFSLDEIYRLFWKKERLLPTETDNIIENVEKISENIPLQSQIYFGIKRK